MNGIDVKFSGEHSAQISIDLPENELTPILTQFFAQKQKEATVKGFRKGKAPIKMIQRVFAKEARAAASDRVIELAYTMAIRDHKLKPLSQPKVNNFKDENGQLKCYMTVEVLKPIMLGQYLGLELKNTEEPDFGAEVEGTLTQLNKIAPNLAEIVDKTYAAREGDVVDVDFVSKVDGATFEEKTGYRIKLGDKLFVEGFEGNVLGMIEGESKQFSLSFPADYVNAEVAGKAIDFDVKVNGVFTIEDNTEDELAVKVGLADGAALRAQVKAEVAEKHKVANRENLENQIIEKLNEGHTFSIPNSMIMNELVSVRRDHADLTEEQQLETAKKYVKTSIILNSIYERHPEIAVKEEELKAKIAELAAKSGKTVEETTKELASKGMLDYYLAYLKNSKVIDFVIQMADFGDEDQVVETAEVKLITNTSIGE